MLVLVVFYHSKIIFCSNKPDQAARWALNTAVRTRQGRKNEKKMYWRQNFEEKNFFFHIFTFFSPFSIIKWPYLLNGWTDLVAQKSIRCPLKNSTFWSPIFPNSIKKRLSYDFLNELNILTKYFMWTRDKFRAVCASPRSVFELKSC